MHTLLLTFNSKQSRPIEEATNKISKPRIPVKSMTMSKIINKEIFRRRGYEMRDMFFATIFPICNVRW